MTPGSRTNVATATGDPVTYAEAKSYLRLSTDDEQSDVTKLITAATKFAENVTRRNFMRQTWDLKLERFPLEIEVPFPPLQSVSSITYVNTEGTTATLATTVYQIDTNSEPGRIMPAFGQSWPSTRSDIYNAVTIRFIAGYATTTTSQEDAVPDGIKQAIKYHVNHMFEHREPLVLGTITSKVPDTIENLYWQFKLVEAV